MSLLIDKAGLKDAAFLAELAATAFTDTFGHLYTPANLSYYLENSCSEKYFLEALGKDTILAAREEDSLVGYIKYGKVGLPVEHTNGDAEIHRLYIRKSHQSKGLGKMLMAAAFEDRFLNSADNIFLCVWENNFRAQKFYQNYGFIVVGECPYQVGTQTDRELVLRKKNKA